jgi:hypothetical protein
VVADREAGAEAEELDSTVDESRSGLRLQLDTGTGEPRRPGARLCAWNDLPEWFDGRVELGLIELELVELEFLELEQLVMELVELEFKC